VQSTPISLFIEVYVDPSLCIGCRTCIDECSMGVFEMDGDKAYAVHASVCIGCFKCREFCPNHAIQTRWIMRA